MSQPRDPQIILETLLAAARADRRRCRRCPAGRERVGQCLLPARQARRYRARRKRRSGPARLCRPPGRLRLLHRFFRGCHRALPARAVAMARLAPEDKFAGLAPPIAGARHSRSRPRGPERARCRDPGRARPRGGTARPGVPGVTNSEGGGASFRAAPSRSPPAPDFSAAMPAPATASASRCWPAKAPRWSATTTMPARATPAIWKARRPSAARAGERQSRGSIPAR